jgi:hypothetical protein
VTDAKGIVEIIMLLPGQQAARVRRRAAKLLVRYLGGDLAIIDEVCALRGLQEQLAADRPEDPRRIFGEAMEASGSTGTVAAQLARACTEALAGAVPRIIDRLTAHMDERLAQLDGRQRVNLNVRAPKRAAPYDPPIARDIAGARPFPVAKFLDQKEREDPTWRESRRSFAPTFGMLVQVLKKKRLKEEGRPAVWVEQNQRPQILYTDDDRELMEQAWQMAAAHREDLVSRSPAPAALPAPAPVVPRVLAMLQGGM